MELQRKSALISGSRVRKIKTPADKIDEVMIPGLLRTRQQYSIFTTVSPLDRILFITDIMSTYPEYEN